MQEKTILQGFEYAKQVYAQKGIDVESAIERADKIAVSMQCWQGDDVLGFDGVGGLTGGISTTGNYPGRARNADELRDDIKKAVSLIPGKTKLNLHASYAEKNGKSVDRDQYTVEQFGGWIDFAKQNKLALDFNPTYFSHPMMDGDFSLSSTDDKKRNFWIEHGKRCREIGLEFAKQIGEPCAINFWMPDGFKDTCADAASWRKRMIKSLDEIFSVDIDKKLVPCAVESKLFGIGVESYTVASHEFSLGYAISRNIGYTLDSGHFHPTETISGKISSVLQFVDYILLHVSRGVRWDSDHVITYDNELQSIFDEIVGHGYKSKTHIGLDYFDASINRVAAWAIGMRNARKAALNAELCDFESLRKAELEGDFTKRLALNEERKTMPFGAVWDYYCLQKDVKVKDGFIESIDDYFKNVQSKRG